MVVKKGMLLYNALEENREAQEALVPLFAENTLSLSFKRAEYPFNNMLGNLGDVKSTPPLENEVSGSHGPG
jgi:hypothetical protein